MFLGIFRHTAGWLVRVIYAYFLYQYVQFILLYAKVCLLDIEFDRPLLHRN
jgi:hypothetical protein